MSQKGLGIIKNQPIRVLHATPRMQREGIQSFLMNLYRNIDREKVQFDFLVHSMEDGAFDAEIEQMGGHIYRVHRMSSLHFLHYNREVAQVLKGYPYKIVHSHINLLSSFTLKVAMAQGIPVRIAHSHSSSILDSGFKRLIKLYARNQMPKYATHCFACSKDAAVWQFGKEFCDNGKVRFIPNGIEIAKYSFSLEKRRTIRRALKIGDEDFVIGHVGAFRKVKNHSFLAQVFAELKKLKPNAKLLLVGSGEMEEDTRCKLDELGVLDDTIFAGSVANVCDYYSAMDIFVFPSVYEGLGIALVEAQAAGLPCFVSDTVAGDAALSEQYYTLSLQDPPSIWGESILSKSKISPLSASPDSPPRPSSPDVQKYDIQKVARDMQDFYLSFVL